MSTILFAGSRVKLQRASTFIAELESALNAFNTNDPISAKLVFVDNEPKVLVEWKALDLSLGAVMGDAVHNMRTALDLMACELVRINNENDKNVYFPFAASEAELPDLIKKKEFS
jgi:hypothetical protein